MSHHHIGIVILLFVTGALLLGAGTRQLLKKSKLPYSVALLLMGLLIGLLERSGLAGGEDRLLTDIVAVIAETDPLIILFLFLPTLIFESAFAIETHLFRRAFPQIALLAVPGLIMATLLTALVAKTAFPWDWSWPVALLFGALISATDPVAVVALLKEMSSRKRLETMLEGESLLNDGTAIVLFTLFYSLIAASEGASLNPLTVVGDFIWVVLSGFMVGLIIGWVAVLCIGKVFNDPLIEISLSIAVAYLVFYVAEGLLHVSGVVALVTLGILFASAGRTRISPEVASFLRHFWELMAYVANTLIFLLVGILIAKRVQLDDPQAWLALGILYVSIMLIRAFSISLLLPILERIGIGFGRDKAMVLVWGGLRGAVALAMALSVAQSDNIPAPIGDQILFLCAGIVVLTILINGGSFSFLLNRLGLDRLPAAKQATVNKAEHSIRVELDKTLAEIQSADSLPNTDWEAVRRQITQRRARYTSSNVSAATKSLSREDLLIALKRRILEAERKYYWQQFSEGTLSRRAATSLVGAVEDALDGEPTLQPRRGLRRYSQLSAWAAKFKEGGKFGAWFQRITGSQLALSYEIARGFIMAQRDSLIHLKRLAPDQLSEAQVRRDIDLNIIRAEQVMAILARQQAGLPRQLETRLANRILLNHRRSLIEELAEKGVLDTPEAERMITEVERQMALMEKGGTG